MNCFSLFLDMSSGWVGGIQLTDFCYLASYSVVNYKKPVCTVVFCGEAKRRGITLPHPTDYKFTVHPYFSYPGTLGPSVGNFRMYRKHYSMPQPATPITTPNYIHLRCLLKTAQLREVPAYWGSVSDMCLFVFVVVVLNLFINFFIRSSFFRRSPNLGATHTESGKRWWDIFIKIILFTSHTTITLQVIKDTPTAL